MFIAGIYCRISIDDDKNNSIVNQKDILCEYSRKEKIKIYKVYVDSGYSGTNFNRPDFQKMIKDIENKKINTIIVKDLSRLGRDYLEVGYYIQKFFPLYNIRLISLNDNLDTINDYEVHFIAIKNVINEYYAKDISQKIRFTINSQMKQCIAQRTKVPMYGYYYDQNGVRVVDTYLKDIIKKIYERFCSGKTIKEIIDFLETNNIPTSTKYYLNKNSNWSYSMVKNILTNFEYLGYYSRHKTYKKFKEKRINVSIKNQFYSEEPSLKIIEDNLFYKAQTLLRKKDE